MALEPGGDFPLCTAHRKRVCVKFGGRLVLLEARHVMPMFRLVSQTRMGSFPATTVPGQAEGVAESLLGLLSLR